MKKILLAVCGLTPQVITEALYALWHEGRPVNAVHIITTRTGKDNILTDLLASDSGGYPALLTELDLQEQSIEFDTRNLHVIKGSSGIEIDDIITTEDNEMLIKTCLDLAFHLTSSPDTAVYFLVAGGRKTMTSCLTLAAQLYGRPQDRIFHVLLSPEFENCRDFCFPPKISVPITLRDRKGQPYVKESRYAKIHLITIPFVSVRNMLDSSLLNQPRPPAELMQSLVRDKPKVLTISLTETKIIYSGRELDMHPARLALYAFFAEQKKDCNRKTSCTDCHDCFKNVSDIITSPDIVKMYRRIPSSRLFSEMSDSGISSLSKENFYSYKSKIRKDIHRTYGQGHTASLEITGRGIRPNTRYGINLDRQHIRLEW